MPSYPDAPEGLIAHWESRRNPMLGLPNGGLPDGAAEFAPLKGQRVIAPAGGPVDSSRVQKKLHDLRVELAGCSELALLHGLAIAHLRKRRWPADAPVLFRRLWVEEADFLLADLPMRWLISAAITFASHGETAEERHLGQSLNVLFSLVKLYEFERGFSGRAADQPFRASRRGRPPLPMGLPSFALVHGKLDIEFLAPIWRDALQTPVLGPLACALLTRLNEDPGTLFRRITRMRADAIALRRMRGETGGSPDTDADDAAG